MRKFFVTMLFLVSLFTLAFGQTEISGDITEDVTWYANQDYLLTGQTFVKAGATLTIEPGTIIKSTQDDGTGLAPTLVIERGAKIVANGTREMPITFTSNLPESELPARGTWGGLIILGHAPTNKGENFVEGLAGVPYGGDDPADNSGILRYVRVWYGGRSIGQDNEINGITFAGVGNGTIVEHCEVAYNLDDGFEFFGGTVNVKNLSALFVGDDAFDTDEGYQGKGQFLFAMQGTDICGRGFEMDNSGSNMDEQPRSYPQFSNVTLIGPDGGSPSNDGSDELIRLREGTGGDFRNMVLAYGNGVGLRVKDDATQALIGDSLMFSSNSVIFDCPDGQFHADIAGQFTAEDVDPQFRALEGRQGSGLVDPRPADGSVLLNDAVDLENDGFFTQVDFVGAFGYNLWLRGWSILDEQGRLPEATVNEISGDITANETWVASEEYLLTGQTFVKAGVTLTIEPGTVIKALPDDGQGLAPTLVVERGGKLIADGTKAKPITFTSNLPESELPARGTWGGLIILGHAPTNKGENFVEGLAGVPYGGDDPADNSGILRYVRVWYGGRSIGQDNEINGITFAGVGNGTIVEHCEVAYNLDDGFEFFGGTVNVKNLSALFVGDDAFDTDEGYQGKGQFLFAMQGTDICGRGFEMDNSGSNMDEQPRSYPQFSNVTLIGPDGGSPSNDGSDELIRLREGTGGDFRNMVLAYGNGVGLRVKDDATQALIGDSLMFSSNSVIFDCPDGQFHADIAGQFTAEDVDPQFRALEGRQETGMIDPRPADGSSLLNNSVTLEEDGFFNQVDFVGAFGHNLWIRGWSILEEQGRIPAPTVNEISGDITSNVTWVANEEYLLTGQTFVKAGAILTIEPGTVIKALPDDGQGLAPALVIERGAKIMAEGTAENPITFTSNLPETELPARGTWGGLIILGYAPTNKGENMVEGLAGVPYGGGNPSDDSGVLKYVRVWYGGRSIGQDNEINGITFAGVGNGTTVEHCEVAYNLDDGFEFFGGTVNVKYLSALFVGDDAFDTDEGYQGKGQFLVTVQGQDICGRGFEMDNSGSNMDEQPRSYPQFSNVTLVGPGGGSPSNDGSDELIRLREGTGGDFRNMVLAYGNGVGLRVKDDATIALVGDSIAFSSNSIIFDCPDGQFHSDIAGSFTANDTDPMFRQLDGREADGMIDLRPAYESPLYGSAVALEDDGFFTQVDFVGAFGDDQWLAGWSILDEQGRLGHTTAIDDNDSDIEVATSYGLSSYPNPFNPTANVKFSIPSAQDVKVSVYDLTGREIMTLANNTYKAGYHTVTFNAADLSSGIYFVKLQTSNKVITKPVTLLK